MREVIKTMEIRDGLLLYDVNGPCEMVYTVLCWWEAQAKGLGFFYVMFPWDLAGIWLHKSIDPLPVMPLIEFYQREILYVCYCMQNRKIVEN